MKRVEINKETKKTNFKLKLKDESQKIREANFIQELEQDIKRVETEKKIKKYNYQTEKHASSLEEQKEMKTRGQSGGRSVLVESESQRSKQPGLVVTQIVHFYPFVGHLWTMNRCLKL